MDAQMQANFNTLAAAAAQRGRELMAMPRQPAVPILSKTRKSRGMVYQGQPTGMMAQFSKTLEGKRKVHITGRYGNFADVDITFTEGDTAIYDSYNFDYLGEIQSITEKSVKIKASCGGRVHQLDLATFANRNYDFSIEKSAAKRAAWYD